MLKEVKSIDEKLRPAHKYWYAFLILAVMGPILLGGGFAKPSIILIILGCISMVLAPVSVIICMEIWKKAR